MAKTESSLESPCLTDRKSLPFDPRFIYLQILCLLHGPFPSIRQLPLIHVTHFPNLQIYSTGKQKLEKLRIESETHAGRAEKAETEVKQLKDELAKKDTEVQNLNNKVTLLQMDLDRSEKRVEEVGIYFLVE